MAAANRHRPRHLIRSFEAKALRRRPLHVKLADELTSFFGSFGFLTINTLVFITWILINSGKIPFLPIFDPFPYVLLITFVSLEAIILTTIVLMSQNREGLLSSLREEMDLQVNFFAEKEITKALFLLHEIAKKQGIKIDDPELQDMLKTLDQSYIERKLEAQILPKPKPTLKLPLPPKPKASV